MKTLMLIVCGLGLLLSGCVIRPVEYYDSPKYGEVIIVRPDYGWHHHGW